MSRRRRIAPRYPCCPRGSGIRPARTADRRGRAGYRSHPRVICVICAEREGASKRVIGRVIRASSRGARPPHSPRCQRGSNLTLELAARREAQIPRCVDDHAERGSLAVSPTTSSRSSVARYQTQRRCSGTRRPWARTWRRPSRSSAMSTSAGPGSSRASHKSRTTRPTARRAPGLHPNATKRLVRSPDVRDACRTRQSAPEARPSRPSDRAPRASAHGSRHVRPLRCQRARGPPRRQEGARAVGASTWVP
jgi:hypothetical protein